MSVIEKERVQERPATQAPAPRQWFGAAFWALAIIALAAVAVVVFLFVTGEDETATATAPDFRSEQQVLAELANQGYIPSEAVDWQQLRTEQLVNQGLIPALTLEPYTAPVEPLFTSEELLMIELAETGQIPMQAVDWDRMELKKLVNQGLIPRQALDN